MNWFFVENLDCFDFAESASLSTSADGYYYPNGIDFKSDGSQVTYISQSGTAVTNSLTSFDLSTEAFVRATDFSSDITGACLGCVWGDSGDFFYISSTSGSSSYINRFACSTPYDTSTKGTKTTATISSSGFLVGDLFWKPDGTKLFTIYRDNNISGSLHKAVSINLNTAWDIEDIGSTSTIDISSYYTAWSPLGIWLNSTGTGALISDTSGLSGKVVKCSLDAYDITTLQKVSDSSDIQGASSVFSKDDSYNNVFVTKVATHEIIDYAKTCEANFPVDGLGEVVNAYGTRNMVDSYTGNVMRVRRASDNTEQDFTADEVADGTLTTFTGASNGYVVKLYDQVGSNDITAPIANSQTRIVASGTLNTDGNGVPYTSRTSGGGTTNGVLTTDSAISGDSWLTCLYAGSVPTSYNFSIVQKSSYVNWNNRGNSSTEFSPSSTGATTFGVDVDDNETMVALFQAEGGVGNNKMWMNNTTQGSVSGSVASPTADTSTSFKIELGLSYGTDTNNIFYGVSLYNTQQEDNQVSLMNNISSIYELGL